MNFQNKIPERRQLFTVGIQVICEFGFFVSLWLYGFIKNNRGHCRGEATPSLLTLSGVFRSPVMKCLPILNGEWKGGNFDIGASLLLTTSAAVTVATKQQQV